MLELTKADVWFNKNTPDQVHALREIDLKADDDSFIMVVGTNGAGKSTLVGAIAGNVRLSSGRVAIGGQDVTSISEARRAHRVARVFADPLAGTVADMSIEDNFAMSLARGRRRGLRPAVTARVRNSIREAVATLGLGLENRLNENVGRLSSGQRQSLTLLMACAAEPDVLILDEHLAALDPVTRTRVSDLTVAAAERAGCTTVMITHSMSDAVTLGDRLLVMDAGQIVADVGGAEKQNMTVDDLVAEIARKDVELSDRSMLEQL